MLKASRITVLGHNDLKYFVKGPF